MLLLGSILKVFKSVKLKDIPGIHNEAKTGHILGDLDVYIIDYKNSIGTVYERDYVIDMKYLTDAQKENIYDFEKFDSEGLQYLFRYNAYFITTFSDKPDNYKGNRHVSINKNKSIVFLDPEIPLSHKILGDMAFFRKISYTKEEYIKHLEFMNLELSYGKNPMGKIKLIKYSNIESKKRFIDSLNKIHTITIKDMELFELWKNPEELFKSLDENAKIICNEILSKKINEKEIYSSSTSLTMAFAKMISEKVFCENSKIERIIISDFPNKYDDTRRFYFANIIRLLLVKGIDIVYITENTGIAYSIKRAMQFLEENVEEQEI